MGDFGRPEANIRAPGRDPCCHSRRREILTHPAPIAVYCVRLSAAGTRSVVRLLLQVVPVEPSARRRLTTPCPAIGCRLSSAFSPGLPAPGIHPSLSYQPRKVLGRPRCDLRTIATRECID